MFSNTRSARFWNPGRSWSRGPVRTSTKSRTSKFEIRDSQGQIDSLPPLVITDLREAHGITADIHRQGSRHLSIHDLGLAQCRSNVAIDGSITRLFPYPEA